MYCVRKVTNDLYWVGANDHRLALFENCFPIPRGVSYNAYCLLDEKTVLFDTVDWSACRQLLENLAYVLDGRELDYLLVNHLEPDHAACIEEILLRHPKVKLISNEKAFMLMRQFGFHVDGHECIEVKEGDTFSFGKHTVTFVGAPMVHWPEAMVTLDVTDGVLFSADAFGTFGALDGKLFADEVDFERDWLDDAPPLPHQHRGQVRPPHPAPAEKGRRRFGSDQVHLPAPRPRVAQGSGLVHRKVRHMEPLCP